MALTKETILINTILQNNFSGPAKKMSQSSQEMERNLQALHNVSAQTGVGVKQVAQYFQKNNLVMKSHGNAVDTLTGKQKNLVTVSRDLAKDTAITNLTKRIDNLGKVSQTSSKKVKGFHFEWLGVMFAGMALYRVFGGLIKSQMELLGIMELFSAVATIVLLPIMMLLLPIFLWLADVFLNMSPAAKLVIGLFILIAAAIGLIMMVIGQVMLGIGALAIVFKVSGGAILGIIGGIIAIFVGLGLIIVGIYNIAKGKLEGIGLIIMGIGVILLLFIGWWALIPIAVGYVVYLVIKYWDKVKGFFVRFWAGLKEGFKIMWDWIVDKAKWVWKKMTSIFEGTIFGDFMAFGGKILGSFQSGGTIPQTGPYMLHKGETVIPAGGGTMNAPTSITVNANVSSDYDVRRLADQLSKYWAADFERRSAARGTV